MLIVYDISIQLQVKCQACFALRNLASDGRYAYKKCIINMNFKVYVHITPGYRCIAIITVYTLDTDTKIFYLKVF